MEVTEVELDGPREGEILIRNVATGVCHTDAYTLSGEDPEGLFPSILGHEGGAIVEEVGVGVSSVSVRVMSSPCMFQNVRNASSANQEKPIFAKRSELHRVKD